jgi:hypothetical protein
VTFVSTPCWLVEGMGSMPTAIQKTTKIGLGGNSRDIDVEKIVRQLNAMCKNATFDFAMSVGKLIVDNFYGGDIAAWRNRGPKDISFRKLANHPDLPMSAAALYRSTAIYELCQRVGASNWKHISTSHCRLVLPLPMGQQTRLLERAETNHWTVQRLREEIDTLPAVVGCGHGGRRRHSPVRKALGALRPRLDALNSLLTADDAEGELSPESARSIVEIVHSVRHACSVLEARACTGLRNSRSAAASSFAEGTGAVEEDRDFSVQPRVATAKG